MHLALQNAETQGMIQCHGLQSVLQAGSHLHPLVSVA